MQMVNTALHQHQPLQEGLEDGGFGDNKTRISCQNADNVFFYLND